MALTDKRRRFSSVQIIVLFYLSAVLISTLLLMLPIFHQPGARLTFLDSLFTASSAISVTGLTVIAIHEVFNQWGLLLLTLLFQIGGIGIMTLGTFFWLVLRQRIGLEQRKWIATDHNRPTLAGLVSLMRSILLLAIFIELAGTIMLGSYFLAAGYHADWYTAYFHGFFASVSAFTNAGFDIYGNSLIGFSHDYVFQLIHMVLMVLGAIGFPVLVEVKDYIAHRRLNRRFTFSLFTKITTLTYLILSVAGALFFLLFEWDGFLAHKSWDESLFFALFQSLSTRSAGLTTMDVSVLSTPTLVMLSALMFIGASPNSVGGGIRTTTFFVMIATVIAYMRGRKDVKVFGRELEEDDIMRSFLVFFVAVSLVFAAIVLLVWIEGQPIQQVFFEVCSAFGTTGMSMGITSELSTSGRVILIITMLIGRIGIISLLLLLKKDERQIRYHYPKERVIIGQ